MLDIVEAMGAYEAAAAAVRKRLDVARELVEALGTPDSLSDLRHSLDMLTELVQAAGDLDRAGPLHAESRSLPAADVP